VQSPGNDGVNRQYSIVLTSEADPGENTQQTSSSRGPVMRRKTTLHKPTKKQDKVSQSIEAIKQENFEAYDKNMLTDSPKVGAIDEIAQKHLEEEQYDMEQLELIEKDRGAEMMIIEDEPPRGDELDDIEQTAVKRSVVESPASYTQDVKATRPVQKKAAPHKKNPNNS
jgi:hypothetical protein